MAKQPFLIYRANLDNLEIPVESSISTENSIFDFKEIPWDCLEENKRNLVYDYLYNKLDFGRIAAKYNLNNKARAKLEFYYCLTKLSEFAKMRELLAEKELELTITQKTILNYYYYDNFTLQQIAELLGVTKQNIQYHIKKVITDFNVQWVIFIKKVNNKVIYNIPEILNR